MWLFASVWICINLLLVTANVANIPDSQDQKVQDYFLNRIQRIDYFERNGEDYWPCPIPEDISPCICIVTDKEKVIMDIDCSVARSQDELVKAFNAFMPFSEYQNLFINAQEASPQLTYLNLLSFGQASFKTVQITQTFINEIGDGTFDNSHTSLKSLDLSDNVITSFPFESLVEYEVLTTLKLTNNRILEVQMLESNSLKELHLRKNDGITFGTGLISSAEYLEILDLAESGITQLIGNMFAPLSSLKTIRLESNALTLLETSAISPPHDTLINVNLDDNPISDIQVDAISGLAPSAEIHLNNAQMVELDEGVWQPYASKLSNQAIKLSGNPLRCGCDIAWMYDEHTSYFQMFEQTATCSDGFFLYDINPKVFEVHC